MIKSGVDRGSGCEMREKVEMCHEGQLVKDLKHQINQVGFYSA